jgi:hypothetical protein
MEVMRTRVITALMILVLTGNFCFSQPSDGPGKPPSLKEQLKMVNGKICTPLNLDKAQT